MRALYSPVALIAAVFVFGAFGDVRAQGVKKESRAAKVQLALAKNADEPWLGDLSGMIKRRQVRILLPYSRSFFYIDKGDRKGIAYEILTHFEKYLNPGSKAKNKGAIEKIRVVLIPTRRDELLKRLVEGRGDIAVANLTITEGRRKLVDFSSPFLTDVKEFIVTPAPAPELASVDDLAGRTVHVRKSSSYWESLTELNKRLVAEQKAPVNLIEANPLLEDEDLLEMVNAEAIPAIVVDSHKARFWAGVFSNIKLHEKAPVREGGEIAWAFRKNSPELAERVNAFAKTVKFGTDTGSVIFATYLKQQKWLKKLNDEEDRKKFLNLIGLFQKYGGQYDINWLILAAKSYQESRFRQETRGPAGAVGVMQIKPVTAAGKEVGIHDVATNIDNNVHAGTKYIRFLLDRYYDDLSADPFNQTLIGFAGYNAGPTRIAKLRKMAEERGLDGTKWFNNLEWVVAEQVGSITVNYVRNIYQYFIIYSEIYDRHLQLEKLKSR